MSSRLYIDPKTGETLRPGRLFTSFCKPVFLQSFNYGQDAPLSKLQIGILRRTIMKRTLLTVAAILMLSATLLAQGGPGGPRAGGQGPNPGAALKNALGLTDAQVTAIQTLSQTEKTRVQAIMTDIRQKRQTLDALLNLASPNPADVGNAAIALHAAQSKLPPERDYFISELKKLLTGEQQQKLDTILAANGGRGLPIPGLGPGRFGFRGSRGQR
jgi:Spy/CpxP family protein refolding chaperone